MRTEPEFGKFYSRKCHMLHEYLVPGGGQSTLAPVVLKSLALNETLPSFKSLAIFVEMEDLVFFPFCWELSNISVFSSSRLLPRRNRRKK